MPRAVNPADCLPSPGARPGSRLSVAPRPALPLGRFAGSEFPDTRKMNHQTFAVDDQAPGRRRRFLLQRINEDVFTRPRSVMAAMLACLEAQRTNLARGRLQRGEQWEPVTLVPTRHGEPYLEIDEGPGAGCWRLMVRIENAVSYKSLGEITDPAQRLMTAEQAGAGLALFGNLSEGIDFSTLSSALPGYRDTRFYYDQLLSVLAGSRTLAQAEAFLPADPEVRRATERHFLVHLPTGEYRRRLDDPEVRPFLELLRENEDAAMLLTNELSAGRIRSSVIHGDTKLENFLFDAPSRRVRSLIDLDTIMAHTWLSDWGDMVRSFCNIAGEKEARLDLDPHRHGHLQRGRARLSSLCPQRARPRAGIAGGRRADHRARARHALPHRLSAWRQLLQARADRPARAQ